MVEGGVGGVSSGYFCKVEVSPSSALSGGCTHAVPALRD